MVNNAKPHIIWVVTDSARNFSTGGLDDRDRPQFYNTLLTEFVNFENAVTSAPSSVMSGSCMLTGMNSYYIGRNYDDFRYEEGAFPNIASILAEEGYETAGLFVAREMREKIAPFIGQVGRRYWPKGVSHAQRMWSNETANEILENYLSKRSASVPLFLMHWNNIRHDARISENLADLTATLKRHGYYDNAIILFCADHGYPHPRRGFTPESLKREGLTHDLMLGDDNILIPLLIKTPDCEPASVKAQVGTVDLFPTVLEYAGVKSYACKGDFPQNGYSLRPLLIGCHDTSIFDQRAIRCDCRFFGQTQRKTAIRQGRYKYVYSHDDGIEEFYDTEVDPSEDTSLANKLEYRGAIADLRAKFQAEEAKANNFQQQYVVKKFVRSISSARLSRKLIIFSLQERQMNDCLLLAMGDDAVGESRILAFLGDTSVSAPYILNNSVETLVPGSSELAAIHSLISDGAHLIFLGSQADNENLAFLQDLRDAGLKIQLKFDINFQTSEKINWGPSRYWQALMNRKELILKEPLLLWTYAKEFANRISKKIGNP